MSYYKEQLKSWLASKEVSGEQVLSVGNLNDDSKYFKSFQVGKVVTLDITPEFGADIVWDMNKWAAVMSYDWVSRYQQGFDHLFTFELWEYIYDPMTALRNCNDFLRVGGQLWISAPFIYPTHNPTDADFLRYTEHFWQNILPLHGFKIIEYKRRVWKEPQFFIQGVSHDGMRPAKDYAHHNITGHLVVAEKERTWKQ